ncbi:hypothetical protein [Luteolibacter sp. Populi]|uniref:hypothetical protein n=1 Tax=Luteolibacter sp. Populi TaxID=3230487 RepID=UPI003465BAB8
MKIPPRKAAVAIGIGLLGCAVVAVIEFSRSSPIENEGSNLGSGAAPDHGTDADDRPGKSGGDAATSTESDPPHRGKTEKRPSDAELANQRMERHRKELVDALEKYKEAGMGERHPNVVKATDDLKKFEVKQAAADEGDKAAN